MPLSIRLSPLLLSAVLVCVLRISPASAQALGPEFRVNTYTTDTERNPRIAADSGGNFVVVWLSAVQDGSLSGVFGQRYGSTGAALGAEFRVNTYTTSAQGPPSVASASGGNFVVIWPSYTQDGSGFGVFGQRYSSAGPPLGAEFRVNTYTTGYQRFTSVASASGGNFVVVWQSFAQVGSVYGIFGQRYGSAGTPLGTEFRVNTDTASNQRLASVASDPGGNFVVVWTSTTQYGSLTGIFSQRFGSAGAPLGTEFRVNTYTTDTQAVPSVASDSSGNFVVAWASYMQDGSLYGVFGQRYSSAGAPIGAEFRVNTYTPHVQVYPSVASDSDGSFVVVWGSDTQDGSSYGVFGQRYGSAGAPLGPEFRVNTYTMGVQRLPSVASLSSGHFVVIWQSDTQDGSNFGIFGQRFCPALSSVTISVIGTTTVCTTTTGGTATVTDVGGGLRAHQWGYRPPAQPVPFPISGATGTSFLISGATLPAGTNFLSCSTTPECGSWIMSNEISVTVTADVTGPTVTPPSPVTTTQTLCM